MKNKIMKTSGIAVLAIMAVSQSVKAEPPRPNILFAIADDASWKSFEAIINKRPN